MPRLIAACECGGWDDDGLLGCVLAEARAEWCRPESMYIEMTRGDERMVLRISDHARNVLRGRQTRQATVAISVAQQPDGGDMTIDQAVSAIIEAAMDNAEEESE